MRVRCEIFYIAAAIVFLFSSTGRAGEQTSPSQSRQRPPPARAEQSELVELMKAAKAGLEELLAAYNDELPRLIAEVARRKKQYEGGEIPRETLDRAELSLATARWHMSEVIQWIVEDELALDEALAREEILRGPALAPGGYAESQTLIRFNGGARWLLADSSKIEKFFLGRFGRALPVSAMGQTSAHDRMRFDHHDAMDEIGRAHV